MIRDVLDGEKNRVENSQRRVSPLVWNLCKGLVSLGLLAWLALRFDWTSVLDALRAVPWFVSGLGILLMILAQMLGARRLQLLLAAQEIHIGYLYSLRLTFAGLFASNFLPSTVGGDAVKVLALARGGHGTGTPVACVVADRLINLVAILFLVPTVAAVPELFEPRITSAIGFGTVGLALGGGLLAGVIYSMCQHAPRPLKAINPGSTLRSRGRRFLDSISMIAVRWAAKPGMLLVALGLSWASVLAAILAVWVAGQGLGIGVGFVHLTAVMVLVYFATLLPVSFNGLGLQEVSLVYLLSRLGAAPEQALALAVSSRLFLVGTSLLGAFDILAWRRPKK